MVHATGAILQKCKYGGYYEFRRKSTVFKKTGKYDPGTVGGNFGSIQTVRL